MILLGACRTATINAVVTQERMLHQQSAMEVLSKIDTWKFSQNCPSKPVMSAIKLVAML